MNELFGIPMDKLVVVLAVLVTVALGAVGALACLLYTSPSPRDRS